MARPQSSSAFTKGPSESAGGPPLIGALLRIPWETVRGRIIERLHQRGYDDLDVPHFNVLTYPGPHDTRPSDLAARLRISKQSLNYLLGELERFGYLERRPDGEDLRAKRIVLTRRGHAAMKVIRETVHDTERDWANRMGTERFAELRALLVELNELA
jgi:DNA-binding MarR family transcriptional regulator